MSSVSMLNTMLNLKLAGSIAAASAPANSDYRALVCLYFGGGIDSFNVLVPRSPAEFATYSTVRANLALAQPKMPPLLPLTVKNDLGGLQLGLHPMLPGLQSLFNNGNAAFVANVGTLLDPAVTVDQFNNGVGSFPLNLFSHSDQTEQWQTSTPDIHSVVGWGGRVADALYSLNSKQDVSMNISLSGGNIWQSGENIFAYSIGTDDNTPATPLTDFDPTVIDPSNANYNPGSVTYARTMAVQRQLALSYQHLLTQEFANRRHSAIDTYQLYNAATSAVTLPSSVNFDESNYLAFQLKMVAEAIAAHAALGHVRQTFYVEVDGWDMHSMLLSGMNAQLPAVDQAITAFYNCLAQMNPSLVANVTTFSASEFARTLTSNGDGTDHAWGSNQFVFGGAVNGGNIYGQYPNLTDVNLDVGRGRFIPTTPVDMYFAELALWLGVPKSSLSLVLPNIGRFYDTTSSSSPMGFLA